VNLLAIESATNLVGAAVLTDSGSAAERSHHGGRQHAELLAPAIEEVCGLSGLRVDEIGVIAVDVGPGLFTGLRVGVSTAKALAQGLRIGVLAVSSLDILAAGAAAVAGAHGAAVAGAHGAGTVVVVVDGRRGEVFTARYRFYRAVVDADQVLDPAPACVSAPALVTPDVLTQTLIDLDAGPTEPLVIVGDGAVRYAHLLSAVPGGDLDLAERVSSPSPLALARLARLRLEAGAEPVPPVDVVPDYRRQADARINWEQRIVDPGARPRS
jgi:tRNA threonylcarbamoyladenosine biosynthesis protein TsaB